jgi:hypothetical protein
MELLAIFLGVTLLAALTPGLAVMPQSVAVCPAALLRNGF